VWTAKTNSHVFRDPSWLHWAATIPLLAGHIAGIDGCLEVAITLCVCMALAMWTRTRSVTAMPVQVRIAYAALLAIGTAPGMFWVYYVQLIGTTAMVLFGYCPLVRMLTLLPWNRPEPINGPWLMRLILAPAPGGLIDWSRSSHAAPAACSCSCALPPRPQRPDPVAPLA
jgi:hypothetical protein